MVILHERDMADADLIPLAQNLHEKLKPTGTPLIIYDRLSVAQAINAEGLHIAQSNTPCSIARQTLGADKIIGLSCNSLQQVISANDFNIDYIALTPIFNSPESDPTSAPLGLDALRMARKLSNHKVVAFGGIDASNIRDVQNAGADAAAVLSAIVEPANPMKAASVLKFLINN